MNRYLGLRTCVLVTRRRGLRLDTFTEKIGSIQLRPSGAWKIRREDRRHGKSDDWRTSLSYPALHSESKCKTWSNCEMPAAKKRRH